MGYYILTILACIFLTGCIGHPLQHDRAVVQNQSSETLYSDKDSISIQETIIYDDEKHPLILVQDSAIVKYYMLDGTAIDVSLESVHYNDSIENLQWQVMKSIYNDGEDEYNSRELVYILFDSDLVIREIRFLDLHTKKPYKQKLIKAIKCTENNWHADSKSDWYLYRYVQRII